MTEPTCIIPWTYESKREVRVFVDPPLDGMEQRELCLEFGRALLVAEDKQALGDAARTIATAKGYRVTDILGFESVRDHTDPLGNLVSIVLKRS